MMALLEIVLLHDCPSEIVLLRDGTKQLELCDGDTIFPSGHGPQIFANHMISYGCNVPYCTNKNVV